tara:strand:+ start:967 stop:1965 length:999 start_codon:yes stop_codon:yes gene_type:complete
MFIKDEVILSKLKGRYKDSTLNTYDITIRKLFKECYSKNEFVASEMIKYKPVISWIYNMQSTNKASYLNAIYNVYKEYPKHSKRVLEKYKIELDGLRQVECSNRIYTPATEKEKDNSISKEELLSKRDEYDALANSNKDDVSIQIKRLILYLYTEIAPLRNQDYCNCSFSKDDNMNYIDLYNKKLVVIDGKSINSKRDIDLNDTLLSIISNTKDNVKSRFLIPMITDINKQMKSDNFTHFLNNIFDGKKISSSRLRSLYVSKMIDNKTSAKERKMIAKTMAHSIGTQETIYSRDSNLLHSNNSNEELKEQLKKKDDEIANLKEIIKRLSNQI